MPSIGFIGVGHMGGPMARNLVKAGHQVTVFDPNAENAKAVTGAKQAASLVELSATNDIIVSMLPSGRGYTLTYVYLNRRLGGHRKHSTSEAPVAVSGN